MNLHITKSKNAESFYIAKSYVKSNGTTSSVIVRKLGTLAELLPEHGPTRDDVIAWCKEECRLETLKYKEEKKEKSVQITFHADRQLDYNDKKLFQGGYLFAQSVYYKLQLNKTCRKIKSRHKYEYDLNAILSDLIYNRVLNPQSNGFSPTVRELCKLVGLKSTSSMAAQLSNLRDSGHITWIESMPRTITVVEKGVTEA